LNASSTVQHLPASHSPRTLRVVQLLLSDNLAGAEQHVALLSRELAGLGAQVDLICGDRNRPVLEQLEGAAVRVHPLRLGRGHLPVDWREACRALATGAPHIVHAHLGSSLLCGGLLTPPRARLVFTQHFVYPAYQQLRGLRHLLRLMAHRLIHQRVAAAIAPSRAVLSRMTAVEGFPVTRSWAVPHGIDVEGVQARALGSSTVRSELGLPADAPVLLTPARLEPEKGHATLLAALSLLASDHPNACLLLAGSGSLDATLAAQAQRLGLSAHVRFLGHRPDIPRLLAAVTLCVLPSYEEPFGLVLLEAMAVGKAVVACGAGGPVEIVEPGATGLLVPPHNPEALADAISALLFNPDLAHRMGSAGQRRVVDRFSARRMAEDVLRVYYEVLRRRHFGRQATRQCLHSEGNT